MSDEQKPGDPADRAADGAFGGVQSHRAGYGDDKLARLTEWLRAHPTATLASGEGALLLAKIDRLTDKLNMACRDRDIAHAAAQSFARDRDRLTRILAALREPSEGMMQSALKEYGPGQFVAFHRTRLIDAIRAAVAAAEQEVGRE